MLKIHKVLSHKKALPVSLFVFVILIAAVSAVVVYRDNSSDDTVDPNQEIRELLEKRKNQTTDEVLKDLFNDKEEKDQEIIKITQLLFDKKYESVLTEISDLDLNSFDESQKLSILGVTASAYSGLRDTENFILTVEKILGNSQVISNEELNSVWTTNLENAKNGILPPLQGDVTDD